MTARQLVLDLPLPVARRVEDFLPAACNRFALDAVLRWPDWPGVACVLDGPAASGKSHLAEIWVARASAVRIEPGALGADADMADLLGGRRAALVEDADLCADERGLFHLYNVLADRRGHLLLTARRPLAAWGIALADLRSRLNTALTAPILPPDDDLLAAILVKQLVDRGIAVAPGVVDWIVFRVERSFEAVARVAVELDRASLRARRPITAALARDVIDSLAWPGREDA